ncbi:MAG: EAL domain-containing protein [Alphaproteobacteria bacterium]|nr:EAL domain-containing protein [Alphaproteobacteria bacterium]
MNPDKLYPRIQDLASRIRLLHDHAEKESDLEKCAIMDKAVHALARCIDRDQPVFGYEPWHPVSDSAGASSPNEMLLRLKDERGEILPPYEIIMDFYDSGMTEALDTLLFLLGLRQFTRSAERQVSINISARSLLSNDFIKTILGELETLRVNKQVRDGIIIEIHESAPTLVMSKHILGLFHRFGARFAIDDVELSLGDTFRFSEFEDIASFIKIDRKIVCAPQESAHSLPTVISFVRSVLPDAKIVAEGVQSPEHAIELHRLYPEIDFVQGRNLPDRETFRDFWRGYTKAALSF